MLIRCLNSVTKPFSNVEEVTLYGAFSERSNLNVCFPNMRRLSFFGLFKICNSSYVALVHYPNLYHLDLYLDENSVPNIAVLLRLNPQIKSLKFIQFMNFNLMHSLVEHLQTFESLEIEAACLSDCNWIHFKSVNFFKIYFLGTEYSPIPKIPLSFRQLKVFILMVNSVYSNAIQDFININPTIEKWMIYNDVSPKDPLSSINGILNVPQIEKALPFLQEIDFRPGLIRSFPLRWANDYLEKFKSLSKFKFRLRDPDYQYKNVEHCMNEIKVNIDINSNMVTLERKKESD